MFFILVFIIVISQAQGENKGAKYPSFFIMQYLNNEIYSNIYIKNQLLQKTYLLVTFFNYCVASSLTFDCMRLR